MKSAVILSGGTNTIDFVVQNGGGPTGLRVEFLMAIATPVNTAVPEPTSLLLLGSGLVALVQRRRNKK